MAHCIKNYNYFIGIDIAKASFEVARLEDKASKAYTNDKEGWNNFAEDFKEFLPNSLVILETTGGYEKPLTCFLIGNAIDVHRANTRKVKNYIRSYGIQAKTDSIDAKVLARYGKERVEHLELYSIPDSYRDNLRVLSKRRQDLVRIRVQEKNRLQAPDNLYIKESIISIIEFLDRSIESIEQDIAALVSNNTELKEVVEVMETVSGIGKINSIQLLAVIPELGRLSNKQIASLAGVAPYANDSGTKRGYRKTRKGREGIKSVLYLSAMAASRGKSSLSEFYKRLVLRGKLNSVALTALMRKILIIVNSRVRDFYAKKVNLSGAVS